MISLEKREGMEGGLDLCEKRRERGGRMEEKLICEWGGGSWSCEE
jgi:hypothetical protein